MLLARKATAEVTATAAWSEKVAHGSEAYHGHAPRDGNRTDDGPRVIIEDSHFGTKEESSGAYESQTSTGSGLTLLKVSLSHLSIPGQVCCECVIVSDVNCVVNAKTHHNDHGNDL